jgi:hypothetical protein
LNKNGQNSQVLREDWLAEEKEPIPFSETGCPSIQRVNITKRDHCGNQEQNVVGFPDQDCLWTGAFGVNLSHWRAYFGGFARRIQLAFGQVMNHR